MRFCVLGPLVAEADDGTPVTLPRPSQRSTLAALLVNPRQPPTRSQLIDALWGDRPPSDADAALRVRVRDLRRSLPGDDRLLTHESGYRIRIEPGELDAVTFGQLAARGRSALDGGSVEDAARLLAQASRLWREPPLADLPDTPAMRLTANVLLEQWRDVREWLIDAQLALGRHHAVLEQIRAVIATDPLAEHPHVQLMLALYRCGQKSAALAAYGRLRDVTVREFGQEPGPEAQRLLGQMLADSLELEVQQRSMAHAFRQPPGSGVCQLPAPPADFTGRVACLQQLASRLTAGGVPVVVVAGPPGIGKTALAVQAAHLVRGQFPDGQVFSDLGGIAQPRTPAEILAEILRSLGAGAAGMPTALRERAAFVRSVLAGRRVLLLADDAVSAAQVRPLLPGTPGSAVLVTSTSPLPDLEGATSLTLAGLSGDDGGALLAKIVGASSVALDPAGAATVCAACAGLPLALRIAGARVAANPGHGLADLAAAACDGRRLLAELSVGDLSVGGRLDTAWRALDARSRAALRTLAESGRPDLPESLVQSAAMGAADVVQALTDSGLIVRNQETGNYQMAPLAAMHVVAQPPVLGRPT